MSYHCHLLCVSYGRVVVGEVGGAELPNGKMLFFRMEDILKKKQIKETLTDFFHMDTDQ